MIKIELNEICDLLGVKSRVNISNTAVTGFSIDSRNIKKGYIFIAIKGQRFDGHDFIDEALSAGAAAIIVKKSYRRITPGSIPVIQVRDTMIAMAKIASYLRNKSSIPVVAITGTNGKTTVKEMTSHVLSAGYNVLKSPNSYNNTIGVSLTLFNLEERHDIAVMEIGTNHPGEVNELVKIARPRVAVITNIARGHLEHFKTLEGVYKEKINIARSLSKKGCAIFNGDDKLLSKTRLKCKIIFSGLGNNNDFIIKNIRKNINGYDFSVNGVELSIPVRGIHNVFNASMAYVIGVTMGIPVEKIRKKLSSVKLPSMRLEEETHEGITFIDDSYNANPDSFESAIKAMEEIEGARKILVAGDMLELGDTSDILHKNVGRRIAMANIDLLITVGERAGHIALGARENGMGNNKIIEMKNMEEAKNTVYTLFKRGDVVLLKASNSVKIGEIKKCYMTSYTH